MIDDLAYPLLFAAGIVVSAWLWERTRATAGSARSALSHEVFIGGLLGMALGAKLGYLLAEGLWTAPGSIASLGFWLDALGGKTVTGALLGAYAGVEWAKQRVGQRAATGDFFAVTVPFSLALGRVGCVLGGCCLGVPMAPAWYTTLDGHGQPRWPAAVVELAFNLIWCAATFIYARERRRRAAPTRLDGQLFHLYLMGYGLLRFTHEFVRDTPRLFAGISGYHLLPLALCTLGAVRFIQRDLGRLGPVANDV